jgi:hypothetical protein
MTYTPYRRESGVPLPSALIPEHRGWWEEPQNAKDPQERKFRARSLYDMVRSIEGAQRDNHDQNFWNARLYSNRELGSFEWGNGKQINTSLAPVSTYGENLTRSVVDTMMSSVAQNRVKVTPVPRGQTWSLYLQTRRLDKWLHGEFMRMSIPARARAVYKDSCVFGFGCVKVEQEDDGRLCVRRVFPDDFVVDQEEVSGSKGRKPRHVYERRCLRVEEVEGEYGLEPGTLRPEAWRDDRNPGRGWVVVVEAYRLSCHDGPGRHVVCVGDTLLVDEAWDKEWFPYVWYHQEEPLDGFYWPGVVEQVLPYQIRLNEINEVIRDAQDIMGRPRLLVHQGSRVNPADLDNLVARIIQYTGIKPEAVTWPAISAELYSERERLIRACYEQFGLQTMLAQGRLPSQIRVDSAPALQEVQNIGDSRLAEGLTRFEEWHLELARTMVRVMGDGGKDSETVWYTGHKVQIAETIRWSEIDLDEHSYVLTLDVSSTFAQTPAARRDKLERWFDKGVITLEQYLEAENTPDVDSFSSLASAASEDISRVIGLLEEGKWEAPHPMQDLVKGAERVSMGYLRLGRYTEVPQKVRVNFVRWVAQARAISRVGAEGDPSVAPPPAAPPVDPMGAGAGMATPMQPPGPMMGMGA